MQHVMKPATSSFTKYRTKKELNNICYCNRRENYFYYFLFFEIVSVLILFSIYFLSVSFTLFPVLLLLFSFILFFLLFTFLQVGLCASASKTSGEDFTKFFFIKMEG